MAKKILYIEDNEDTANAVKIILSKAGYEADVAYNGTDGLAKAMDGYDLFLIDIMLPDMSGWDIFNDLSKRIDAKFVFLSALPVSKDRLDELKEAGLSDYINKPYTKDELLKRIGAILE